MNLLGLLYYTAVDRNVRATDGEFIVEYMWKAECIIAFPRINTETKD